MRTTITVADDVFAAMEHLRRTEGLGPSEALNLLARRGMAGLGARVDYQYTPVSVDLGARLDYANVGDVLDLLDSEEPS